MFIEIGIVILIFSIGYLLGRLKRFETSISILMQNSSTAEAQQKAPEVLQKEDSHVQYRGENSKIQSKVVKIDDSKFVTDVSTESFKKDFDSGLGEMTTKEDDISQSISKLSQLKNKK